MYGRLLELPILIVLVLAGIALLASVAPALGLAAAALVAAAAIVFFGRRWLEVRRLQVRARTRLEQAAAEHGLQFGIRHEGKVAMHGGVLGIDAARRKVAFASAEAARVADFERLRSISVGIATSLGQSVPSWYSVDLRFDGEPEAFSVATSSRRQVERWLGELGEAFGPECVRDARATLR